MGFFFFYDILHSHNIIPTHVYPPATGNLLEGEAVVRSCRTYLSTRITASVEHCGQGLQSLEPGALKISLC